MSEVFLVTTNVGGAAKTTVWKATRPLAVGHPFRWVLERDGENFRVRDLKPGAGAVRKLSHEKGQAAKLKLSALTLQIRPALTFESFGAALAADAFAPASPFDRRFERRDAENFKRALLYVAGAAAAFLLLTLAWPKPAPDTQELIPPQFAKIVMARQAPAEGAKTGTIGNAPASVQKTAVVQAFRAAALTSAVSGLLKGGMTRLLAQSDFVAGATKDAASATRLFDAGSKALSATAPLTGPSADRNVKVAALGPQGAGYGKSAGGGVSGQGHGFIPMDLGDLGNANVEEGLTKDEVGEVIHRHMSEVRYCYESAMVRTPTLEGKLLVAFTVGAGGQVKAWEVKESDLPDPRLDDCILRRLASWQFPKPKGHVDVAVTYPFIFRTLGR